MTTSFEGIDRRKAERNDDLVQAVIVAVRAEVASQIMPEDIHREHHQLIGEMIAEMKRKRERHEKIKAQVGGWAIITALSGIGTGAYQAFLWAKDHWK
jgi:hypothetical protein